MKRYFDLLFYVYYKYRAGSKYLYGRSPYAEAKAVFAGTLSFNVLASILLFHRLSNNSFWLIASGPFLLFYFLLGYFFQEEELNKMSFDKNAKNKAGAVIIIYFILTIGFFLFSARQHKMKMHSRRYFYFT
jgi:hypothetical protein